MMASHLLLETRRAARAIRIEPGEALLAFGQRCSFGIDAAAAVIESVRTRRSREAAANLFGYLRALDAKAAQTIAVMPFPMMDWRAINDALRRAAVGRDKTDGSERQDHEYRGSLPRRRSRRN